MSTAATVPDGAALELLAAREVANAATEMTTPRRDFLGWMGATALLGTAPEAYWMIEAANHTYARLDDANPYPLPAEGTLSFRGHYHCPVNGFPEKLRHNEVREVSSANGGVTPGTGTGSLPFQLLSTRPLSERSSRVRSPSRQR